MVGNCRGPRVELGRPSRDFRTGGPVLGRATRGRRRIWSPGFPDRALPARAEEGCGLHLRGSLQACVLGREAEALQQPAVRR